MNRKTLISFGVVLAAVAVCLFVTQNVLAQAKPEAKPEAKKTEPPKTEPKKEEAKKPEPPKAEPKKDEAKEVTLVGKLLDLHCFMMGAKEEAAKTGECLKAGAAPILETPAGIYLLSKGPKGTDLAAMAGQEVEIKGKVFEKAGMKYVDFTAITKKGGEAKKAEAKPADKPAEKKPEVKPADKPAEKKPEAKPAEKPAEKKPEPPKTK
jgi:ribonuclease E